MSESTAQEISNAEGEWLDKIKHAKSIAVNMDEDVKSDKTTFTFVDGSKLTFSVAVPRTIKFTNKSSKSTFYSGKP